MLILSCNGVRLLDVATEEEAFAEMQTYLQVNHINSNSTSVVVKERRGDMGHKAKYKQVAMYHNHNRILTFRIYYHCEDPSFEFEPTPSIETTAYLKDLANRKAGGV